MQAFILGLVLCTSAIVCLAQEKVIISNDPPPMAASYPLVSQVGNAQVFYNGRRDETIARTKSVRVYGEDMAGLTLSAEFVSKGRKVAEPETITFKIFYIGKDHAFVEDRNLKIFIDGKESITGTSKFIRANESNVMIAALEKEVSFSDFAKISRSKDVRMQVGPATFALSDLVTQGFADLLNTVER